jgi:hypothetical protein
MQKQKNFNTIIKMIKVISINKLKDMPELQNEVEEEYTCEVVFGTFVTYKHCRAKNMEEAKAKFEKKNYPERIMRIYKS